MPTAPLIVRPGRRLVVELDLSDPLVAGRNVWLELRTGDAARRYLAGQMTSSDRDLWRVEFTGADTALVDGDGWFEAVAYASDEDGEQLAYGPMVLRPAVAHPA